MMSREKLPALFSTLNPIILKELPAQCESFLLWKTCDKPLKPPPVSSLRAELPRLIEALFAVEAEGDHRVRIHLRDPSSGPKF